ncbi:MAG: type II toxin-antitoxin system HicB family antitoxin [Thermodesulfobacteriota bacterium]
MTQHFTAVIEREENGSFSAYVAGLPGVYAAADTAAQARRAIRGALAAHLDTLRELGREPRPRGDVAVLRYDLPARGRRGRLRFVGLGALLGRVTSEAKARAARINGRKGGRPRRAEA